MAPSEQRPRDQLRTYDRHSSVVFLKTHEAFGGLSNMAGGFPLSVNGTSIRTSEALYQACRFPHLPEVQRLIIEQRSPMTAKMKGKPYRQRSRPDWDAIRIKVMRWCLRVKLAQNWTAFGGLLLETGDRPIVEQSRKDEFWGARVVDDATLVGKNFLGRLLMELRESIKRQPQEPLLHVQPLAIADFVLLGHPIEAVHGEPVARTALEPRVAPRRSPVQGVAQDDGSTTLFDRERQDATHEAEPRPGDQENEASPRSGSTGRPMTGPESSGIAGSVTSGGSGSVPINCFLLGTLVTMDNGWRVPIETLQPGDVVASLQIPGLVADAEYRAQYQWRSDGRPGGILRRALPVGAVRIGMHDGFVVINGRVKCTPEHPLLVRRDDGWGFVSAEFVEVGDALFLDALDEEIVVALERVAGRIRTVALQLPGTNTFLADGVWVHTDISLWALTSTSSASASASDVAPSAAGTPGIAASKSSGSSFTTSPRSIVPAAHTMPGIGGRGASQDGGRQPAR